MNNIFKFQVSIENNEKILWLMYKNGAINLNEIARKKGEVIGSALTNAINEYLSKTNGGD